MRYRKLGKTGLEVSEIGFGAEWLERHDEEKGIEMIKRAAELGVNIIDCWMPDPKSRDIIGKGMDGNREHWIVQGHFGSTYQDGQYVRSRDLSYVKPAFEDLLTRLGTDYIDLGMIHYVDTDEVWEECEKTGFFDYVKEMRDKGSIRHIGMSTHSPRIGARAVEEGLVEMLLFSINPAFDMRPATDELEALWEAYDEGLSGIDEERAHLYRLCEERGVGITVMKGFFGGHLFDAEKSPFGAAFTPAQLIHYALTRPAVSSIMCGFNTIEELEEAVSYENATDDEKDYASVIAGAPLHSYSGVCTYCGHCKPCPAGIDIAMVGKFFDLAAAQPEPPAGVSEHYRSLEHTASECVACGGCEERCPFDVPVIERMKKTADLFGC